MDTIVQPVEPVVFLEPWVRPPFHWLHLTDEDGVRAGYVDLRTGDLVAEGPPAVVDAARAVASLVVPCFAADLAGWEDPAVLDALVRRWASTPAVPSVGSALVLAWRWPPAGPPEHLAVQRIGLDRARLQLGWCTLADLAVLGASPFDEGVVRWCGWRYREVCGAASEP